MSQSITLVIMSLPSSTAGSEAQALRVLPPLSAARADLSPSQRRAMVVAMVVAHVGVLAGLMQIGAVRQAVLETAPMFVEMLAPPKPEPPPPPPPQQRPPMPRVQPNPVPIIAAPPAPTPAPPTAFTVAPPPAEPAPAVVEAAPAPVAPPAPPAAPRVIPASAVQYLVPPDVVYPRLSRRNNESGLVLVRAYIDAAGGVPREVSVSQSSGFARLDEAAVAAVQKARFKPHTENGRPVEGWTRIPIHFELEKQ